MASRVVGVTLTLLLALLTLPVASFAQVETGQISGTVTDPQGAVISGATVTVTSKDTGATRTAATSGEGNYTVTNLPPGTYDVKVEGAGFGVKTVPVQVTVGTRTTVDVELAVTTGTESVDIIAGEQGIQVNTENQVLQTVVSEKEIKELPTITRNPYLLVQLSGNVAPVEPGMARGVGMAINGQRPSGTNILLDGADNNDQFGAGIGQDVPLDAVQEFSVLTSNFSAEFGRASAGIVNVATKSGTNVFHGTVYEFNRLSALASKDFDLNAQYPPAGAAENKKGVFTRNQFGYTIGGPVIKDKLLFFNSIEWLRVRSQDTAFTLVPTPEFISQTAPVTQAFFNNYSLRAPISGKVFTAADLGGVNGIAPGTPVLGEVIYSLPADAGGGLPSNQYQLVGRLDYNWTDKTTLYGRYALQSQDFFEGTNAFSPWAGFDTGLTNFNNNFLISLTHVWSDTFVSQSKFVYNRLNNNQPLGEQPVGPTLYLASATVPSTFQGEQIALPGYLPFSPGSAIPFGGPQNLAQFYQDQTWTLGDHSIRFGGSYVRILDNRTFGAYENAVEQVGTTLTSGLNNLVAGTYRSFQVAIDPQGHFPGENIQLPATSPQFFRNNRYNEFAFYVNDSWKIHPRLTLNLGLRYDYFGVQHNTDPSLDSNFYFGPGATRAEQIANGRVFLAEDSPVGALWEKDTNNFGPRLGIAWDVFGDGKTSVRGGYGISYERNFGNVTFNVIQNPPNYAVVTLVNSSGDPLVTSNLGPFASGTGEVTLPRTSLRHVEQDIPTAYAHFWSAAVEHQFGDALVASIEYSGSAGRDLYSIERRNLPFSALFYGLPFDPAGVPGQLPTNPLAYSNPQYGIINTRGANGFSNYNGLTFGVDTRVIGNTGLQFQAKYTWSHSLDNLSSTFSEASNNFNLGLLDPDNPRLDYGSSDFDIRHRFVSSGIWQIPFARDTEGWRKQVLDGWQLTYIYTARTGAPFTVFDCTNGFANCIRLLQTSNALSLTGPDNPAPDAELPNLFTFIDLAGQSSQFGSYLGRADVAAYAEQFGLSGADFGPFPTNMTGRNTFRQPGFWNLDGGVYKNFSLTERYGMQFRAEFYNVFNHANLAVDTANVDVSSTDRVTAFRSGRRQVQLAVKFIF
jgi:outer membrane receptor protein involved in Fe transport